jgi:hypothetical protein
LGMEIKLEVKKISINPLDEKTDSLQK